jgi:hypothetical protein
VLQDRGLPGYLKLDALRLSDTGEPRRGPADRA